MLDEQSLEGGKIDAAGVERHADDLRPMRPRHALEIEIAGIVDQHRVARLQQEAADQVDGARA